MRKKLRDRISRVEQKTVLNLLQRSLNASAFIDSVSGLERAKQILRELRPALVNLAAIHPDVEVRSPEPRRITRWTPQAEAIIQDLIHRGEMIIDLEKVERKKADEALRLEADTSSKLLVKMLAMTSNIDGITDLQSATGQLYVLRRDLEKLARLHPELMFQATADPALRTVTMTKTAEALFADLYLRGDISFDN